MRTLNRPMFNMGGPIKQGIMHGIREPHFRGQIVGKAMPHIKRGWRAFQGLFGSRAPKQVEIGSQIKWRPPVTGHQRGYTGVAKPGGWERGAPITETQNIFTPKPWAAATGKYLKESPEGKIVGWLWSGKGWVPKIAKGAVKSPLVAAGLTYTGVKWVWPDGTEATDAEIKNIQKPGGYPPGKGKGTGTDTTTNADAFANAQREKRLNRYLQLMGYDQSKKTAIADALIDASKIVSDRGTLDRKNITGELINPAIQALSQRLDKPQQIREAVGLMMTKGEIEKDLEDPQVKKLRALEIETKEKLLGENFETDIRNLLLSRKDKVNKKTLEQYARLTADKYGEPFKQVTEETDLTTLDDGIYMSEDKIIRVTDGVPKRIV
jgi:hypothetical protein